MCLRLMEILVQVPNDEVEYKVRVCSCVISGQQLIEATATNQ